MEATSLNHFLSGVIAAPKGGRLAEDSAFRRYRAHVRTTATIGGNTDARNAFIRYEVGRSSGKRGQLLAAPPDDSRRIEASYPTNAVLAEDFLGLAKKYSNFSAQFQFSSLAAVAERLAKGLAVHATVADVDSVALRGGAPLIVAGLGTYDGPINSLISSVFIPRLVNNVLTGDVFSVLANAIAGEGASIATDIAEIDPSTRQPVIPEVDGDGFAKAATEALRIVGANMAQSDQGLLFSLAVTRGIHSVVSWLPTAMKAALLGICCVWTFQCPFVGFITGSKLHGPPSLLSTVSRSVLLCRCHCTDPAAAVAPSDPGENYNGEWFPTFYSGTKGGDPTVRPGGDCPGNSETSGRIRSQLLADCEKFFRNYIPALGRIFGLTGSPNLAVTVAVGMSRFLHADPRHLRYASVAPWYWIEPTSLLPSDFLGSVAEMNGSGSFGGKDSTKTKLAWEDIELAGDRDTTFSAYRAKFLSPRRAWFMAHWNGHPDNGLGCIRLRQADPNGFIHPGRGTSGADLRDRLEDDAPISDYLWDRGQSPFCAPGELLNLGSTIGFLVRHVTFDDDGIPTTEHVPTSREFLDTTVTIEVGRPLSISIGKSNCPDSKARRARTRATIELGAASRRARAFGSAAVAEMPTLSTAPRALTFAPSRLMVKDTGGGAGSSRHGADSGGSGADDAARKADGVPVRATAHNQPVRFPTLANPTGPTRSSAAPAAAARDQSAGGPSVDIVRSGGDAASEVGSDVAPAPAPGVESGVVSSSVAAPTNEGRNDV
ncbi:coat protein [Chalara elegans RNA Virus 1]|uniref:Coat protein n=1 Tax=Chalara elegans RNA Virus 1 TaxID=267285 RepID=Q6Q425_9VIRU|nr:coat protein [Chalara elegans RNA Virus 1]AAS68035.1 coat protein [Chalara elegans RNA Virus 1]